MIPQLKYFDDKKITRNIDCNYNICWFIAASFALHPDIPSNDLR
jgi:hypothetical protein